MKRRLPAFAALLLFVGLASLTAPGAHAEPADHGRQGESVQQQRRDGDEERQEHDLLAAFRLQGLPLRTTAPAGQNHRGKFAKFACANLFRRDVLKLKPVALFHRSDQGSHPQTRA